MPSYKKVPNRSDMIPSAGTMVREDGTVLDVTATLESLLARLVQIVTNTGGDDPVNLETIMQAVQVACEAIQLSNASIDGRMEGVRTFTQETANSTAGSHLELIEIHAVQDQLLALSEQIRDLTVNIEASLDTLDDAVGTHDSAAPASVLMQGQYAESTTPAAVADGDAVRPWYDLYGRLVQLATNLAQSTIDVTDAAPAQMQVLIETGWAALTAPGALTPTIDVRDYENHTIAYDIDIGGCTDVDLIVWGSIDGTLWFPLWEDNITSAETLEDAVQFSGVQVTYIRCEFEAEAGDTDATIVFQITSGN